MNNESNDAVPGMGAFCSLLCEGLRHPRYRFNRGRRAKFKLIGWKYFSSDRNMSAFTALRHGKRTCTVKTRHRETRHIRVISCNRIQGISRLLVPILTSSKVTMYLNQYLQLLQQTLFETTPGTALVLILPLITSSLGVRGTLEHHLWST